MLYFSYKLGSFFARQPLRIHAKHRPFSAVFICGMASALCQEKGPGSTQKTRLCPRKEQRMSTTSERMRAQMKERHMSYVKLEEATGVPKSALQRYATGGTPKIPAERLCAIAAALRCSTAWLLGETEDVGRTAALAKAASMPTALRPVLGTIRAGVPVEAQQDVLDWLPVDVKNPQEYFWLQVAGDSMQGAGILPGARVLIHCQQVAENGDIVACRVGGGDATLKRFQQKSGMAVLMPENSAYQPILVSAAEFACGDAEIIGVATMVMHSLKR